MISKVNKSY